MMVWRDRETGHDHPSIRSAPSTGTFGMSLSVTTFIVALPRVGGIQGIRTPLAGTRLKRRIRRGGGGRAHRRSGDADSPAYRTLAARTFPTTARVSFAVARPG